MSPARPIAFDVLRAVETGAYASDLLAARARTLDSRDAGLASEIVFGVLRYQSQLDHLTSLHVRASRLDPEVRIALRMGIYQLRYLERVPAHAAVAESVELVKRARKRSATGLVNAVLRKITRDPVTFPDRATALSHPAWMLDRWDRQYGPETTEALARADLHPPETWLRVPAGAPLPDAALEPTAVSGCYRLTGGGPGVCRIQDIGSQSIVPLLDLRPGLSFLDLCAAPGNKTAQALEAGVRAFACDFHLHRLRMLAPLGIPLVLLDASRPLPFRGLFDRILLDAPCSGTGTLGRNPEIKWRLKPEDLPALHRLQAAMLAHALAVLAPGGRLVYSTCSLEREENDDVVATVPPALVTRTFRRIPGRDPGDGFYAAVIESEKLVNG